MTKLKSAPSAQISIQSTNKFIWERLYCYEWKWWRRASGDVSTLCKEVSLKFHVGSLLVNEKQGVPDQGTWHRIHSPSSRWSYLLVGFVGMAMLACLLLVLIVSSVIMAGYGGEDTAVSSDPTPWRAVILALLLFIPLHEFLHMIWYPKCGFTSETIVVVWPKKLRFGIYFAGCITRRRWLLMRLTPLVVLSIVPAILLIGFNFVWIPFSLSVFLQVMLLVNTIGSSGDVVAVYLVLRQVPAGAQICFFDGKAYWGTNGHGVA